MTIAFDGIPNGTKLPFFFVEFSTSKAQQGPSVQIYKVLLIGQRIAVGTKPEKQIDLVTSEAQAQKFYGNGSMLASMASAFLKENKTTSLSCISLDDDGAANAAAGIMTFAGTATEAGTVSIKVAGRRYRVGVAIGDTQTDIAAALAAEITADVNRQVDSANALGVLTNTHRNKSEAGNGIDQRVNPEVGEELPAGITVVVGVFAGGTANPDIADVIAAMGDTQFHILGNPYNDAANLTLLETELADRFGPIRQIEGVAMGGKRDTFSNLIIFGDGRNSPHISTEGVDGPSNPWDWAGSRAGVISFNGQIDPARPFQTLPLTAVDGGDDDEVFSFTEKNLLLNDGISSHSVDSGGVVRIDRAITMNQENALGAPDTSLLDVNTLLTLGFLRFDFRTQFQLTYPRHKLGDDGNRFPAGAPIITPKIAKAKAISIFKGWLEDLGLVENIDQFKKDLVVERDASDPNRLNFLLSPDLINQFRQGASQIAFLL